MLERRVSQGAIMSTERKKVEATDAIPFEMRAVPAWVAEVAQEISDGTKYSRDCRLSVGYVAKLIMSAFEGAAAAARPVPQAGEVAVYVRELCSRLRASDMRWRQEAADFVEGQAAALAAKDAEIKSLKDTRNEDGYCIIARNREIAALKAWQQELEAALRPFAEYYAMLERDGRLDGFDLISRQRGDILGHAAIQTPELQAARTALAPAGKEPEHP
jgi:hypothetical protein